MGLTLDRLTRLRLARLLLASFDEIEVVERRGGLTLGGGRVSRLLAPVPLELELGLRLASAGPRRLLCCPELGQLVVAIGTLSDLVVALAPPSILNSDAACLLVDSHRLEVCVADLASPGCLQLRVFETLLEHLHLRLHEDLARRFVHGCQRLLLRGVEHGDALREEPAEEAFLSRWTVSAAVADLATSRGTAPSRGGRRDALLSIRPQRMDLLHLLLLGQL